MGRPSLSVSVLAFFAKGLLNRTVRRALFGTLLGLGAWMAYGALRPKPPDESLTPAETQKIYSALLVRVKPGGVNHLHSRRLYHYAPPFAAAAGASVDVVRAAALLHDSTKEQETPDPKERFCQHGEKGAAFAKSLLVFVGKSEVFAERVSVAVREHMGPCGFNWNFFSKRFMSKFCDRTFPKPSSPEAKVLYDIDMLDLMTVDGVVKVAELRQTSPEFKKEPLKDSVKSGSDSAWKSVVDAKQTLITSKAKDCGDALAGHTEAFVDGIDFDQVKDIAALKLAATQYLESKPLPACLPTVPVWDRSPTP